MKDDLVKVSYDAGNGWWYGCVVETFDQAQNEHLEQGFFPASFVQRLTSLDPGAQPPQPEADQEAGTRG